MPARPVLSQELLVRLYQWGVIGEKFFDDHPTDARSIGKGNTIYPVQARAINRPKLHTTFVDRKKLPKNSRQLLLNCKLKQSLQGRPLPSYYIRRMKFFMLQLWKAN